MVEIPESAENLVYFTNRSLGLGSIKVWVKKETCDKCHNAIMGKPIGDNGKVKIRAKEYVCSSCGNVREKIEYELTLTAEAVYTCPSCGKSGESSIPFNRKKIKGVETLKFSCSHCNEEINVTKKFKEPKK